MNYFAIEHSMNRKIVGKIPHTKEIFYNCSVDDPNLIDRYHFQEIIGVPYLATPILHDRAKQTDIIDTYSVMGFGFGSMVISEKFKNLLTHFKIYSLQYFKTFLIHKNEKIENYWQTHISKIAYECLNFEKTIFVLKQYKEDGGVEIQEIMFRNLKEFLIYVQTLNYPKMLFIKSFYFVEHMNYDYFSLRYTEDCHNGIVSEKLKNEIEKQGITGIEFRPIEISSQNWRHSGEREKIYGL